MNTIVLYIIVAFITAVSSTDPGKPRQRLLFYDEDGNLVKTYSNPYLQNLKLNAGLPIYGNFLNPIFGFIKDFGSTFAFTVPVSNNVIQQINKNPQYHNQFMLYPTNDPVIEPNPLCEGRRAQIPSPSLCNNYLNCWDGWAVEQECPKGLLFSKQGYCDYSDNVNCESRQLKDQQPARTRCNKDFETFRNELNCNEFFVCVNRQPVKFKCPADLAYNQYLGVCDYSTRVDCHSSVIHTDIFNVKASSPKPSPSTTFIPSAVSATIHDPIPLHSAAPAIISPTVIPPSDNLPSQSINSSTPTETPPQIPPQTPEIPTSPALPIIPPMPLLAAFTKPDDTKTIYTENSVVNTQSWTSTHIASSLQDAIQQLQKSNLAKINV